MSCAEYVQKTKCKPVAYQSCKGKNLIFYDYHLQSLTQEYMKIYGESYDVEDIWWGDKTLTWEQAVARAWKSRFEDRNMHPHQYRVSNHLPEGLKLALDNQKQPEIFQDFDALHDWIQNICRDVWGLGATTAYDVARRLGAWLGLKPDLVYLHAGTAQGAKKFGINKKTAELSEFPPEIQALGATHAENFLCIYKDHIFPQCLI